MQTLNTTTTDATSDSDNVATVTPKPETKSDKLVPCESTVAQFEAIGFRKLENVKLVGNWADMLGKALKGNKTHMQIYMPLFNPTGITPRYKFGLHRNDNVAGEVAKIAQVFGGVAMVNDSGKHAQYVIVDTDTKPVIERRTLQGDTANSKFKANVAEFDKRK